MEEGTTLPEMHGSGVTAGAGSGAPAAAEPPLTVPSPEVPVPPAPVDPGVNGSGAMQPVTG